TILEAAEFLSRHEAADLIVAASADELDRQQEGGSEGGAAVVVGLAPSAVRVAGWGIAGPDPLDEATRRALAMAEIERADLTVDSNGFDLLSAGSAMAAVVAFAAVRRERARHALVVAQDRSLSCTLVLGGKA